jgi:predicted phosphodiesterase
MGFIGVVTDSHGDADCLQKILEKLSGAEAVFFLGDMMTVKELDALNAFQGKVVRVHGDHDWAIRHAREGHVPIGNPAIAGNDWRDHLATRAELEEKSRMGEWLAKTHEEYDAHGLNCVLVHGALDGDTRGLTRRNVLAKTNEELNWLWANIDDYATAAKNLAILEQAHGDVLFTGHAHQACVWSMARGTNYLDVVRNKALVELTHGNVTFRKDRVYAVSVPPAHHQYGSCYGLLFPEEKRFEYRRL